VVWVREGDGGDYDVRDGVAGVHGLEGAGERGEVGYGYVGEESASQ
jgi:hypothetical protein